MALFGWLFMNLSGFAFWVVICGSFWFRFLGCHLWLFLVLLPEWLYVALSGFALWVGTRAPTTRCTGTWSHLSTTIRLSRRRMKHQPQARPDVKGICPTVVPRKSNHTARHPDVSGRALARRVTQAILTIYSLRKLAGQWPERHTCQKLVHAVRNAADMRRGAP